MSLHVSLQTAFLRETCATHLTHERFLSRVNSNMADQLCVKKWCVCMNWNGDENIITTTTTKTETKKENRQRRYNTFHIPIIVSNTHTYIPLNGLGRTFHKNQRDMDDASSDMLMEDRETGLYPVPIADFRCPQCSTWMKLCCRM
eukprot:m.24277 g.24277  ORF g.24277 m.24277 type:complete len:145 (-) comp9095_c0_seq2:394-828(-)